MMWVIAIVLQIINCGLIAVLTRDESAPPLWFGTFALLTGLSFYCVRVA